MSLLLSQVSMDRQVLLKVVLPKLDPANHIFKSFKITPRSQNAHAYVNAAFLVEISSIGGIHFCYNTSNVFGIYRNST